MRAAILAATMLCGLATAEAAVFDQPSLQQRGPVPKRHSVLQAGYLGCCGRAGIVQPAGERRQPDLLGNG